MLHRCHDDVDIFNNVVAGCRRYTSGVTSCSVWNYSGPCIEVSDHVSRDPHLPHRDIAGLRLRQCWI